jgi:hypothetical protein
VQNRISLGKCVWVAALAAALAAGCESGGGTPGAENAGGARDDDRATELLQRAREGRDIAKYQRLIGRFPDTKAADEGRDELAALLLAEAEKALKAEDFPTAAARADEARVYAGVDNTDKAYAIAKKVDEGRAKKVAQKALAAAGDGRCASALKTVADPLRQKPRPHFQEVLQKQTGAPLVACLENKLADEIKAGNVEAARTLITSADTTTALTKADYKKAEVLLQKVLVAQSTVEIKPLLADKNWTGALAKLSEMKTSGKLTASEHTIAVSLVQDAIKEDVLATIKSGVTSKKPSAALALADASIKTAAWSKQPKEVETARRTLLVAVECEKAKCKLERPSAAWAWGEVTLGSPTNPAEAADDKLTHAQKLWVIGKSGTRLLVASSDPGAVEGAAALDKATGWAEAKSIKNTDTELWLPPTDQLKNVQVWAPLRAPAKEYHLGTVKSVDGKNATVIRLADKSEVTVPLASLRVGKLTQGLKVLAFCVDSVHTETAKVESVVTSDANMPKVKIVCEKGDISRVEVAGALVTKADWLPPKKP